MTLVDKMVSNSASYRINDKSGYSIEIDTRYDPEFGWAAYVTFSTTGFKDQESAIAHLEPSLEHGLRILKENR